MKNRTYFISSLIIALAVPLIIGSIYFIDVLSQKNNSTFISKLDGMKDLVLLGEQRLSSFDTRNLLNENYQNGNSIEFEVDYTSGKDEITNYDINIKGIEFSPNIELKDVSWKLLKYDSKIQDYKVVKTGTFATEDNKMNILKSAQIDLKESQKYKFYYYISSHENQYNRGTIKAIVTIE